MNRRFLKLYESTLDLYNHGGFLTGDYVKFIDEVLKDEYFKNASADYIAKVKEFMDCGDNLRVVGVKSAFPLAMGTGNPDSNGISFGVEIGKENLGLGRVNNQDTIVVLPKHLHRITDANLPPVPSKYKYDDKSHIDTKEVKDEAEETPFFGPGRTRTTDHGNKKDTKSDSSLLNKTVKIPGEPAKDHKDPGSYVANYLPKA